MQSILVLGLVGLFPVLLESGAGRAEGGFLPLVLVPVVGACVGIGSLALIGGGLCLRKCPTLLPSNLGLVLGTLLLLLPQLGSLHSAFLRLAFTLGSLVHLVLGWEWYAIFQPFRTMVIGIDVESLRPLVQEASLVAQGRIASLGRAASDPSFFEVDIAAHPTVDRTVVMRTDPQAYAFVFFFRLELRRLLENQPMRRPSTMPHLFAGGILLVLLAFWLTSIVA